MAHVSPNCVFLDRLTVLDLLEHLDFEDRVATLAKLTDIHKGNITRLLTALPNGKHRYPYRSTMERLRAGLAERAGGDETPFTVVEQMLVLPKNVMTTVENVQWCADQVVRPWCDYFFAHVHGTVRRMARHPAMLRAPFARFEDAEDALRQTTPSLYQNTFAGGTYVIEPDGVVSAAFTPLDPNKEQLAGENVFTRPYFQPALTLVDRQPPHTSDRFGSLDRGDTPILVVADKVRPDSKEVIGVVDMVVDVDESPLLPWMAVMHRKLLRVIDAPENHPASIVLLDRCDQVIAEHHSDSEWKMDADILMDTLRPRHATIPPTQLQVKEAGGVVCAFAPLHTVAGFTVAVCTQTPRSR